MEIQTRNTLYLLKDLGDGCFLISGHPEFCPTPTKGRLWEKPRIGHNMRITFEEGKYMGIRNSIRTSVIKSIKGMEGF